MATASLSVSGLPSSAVGAQEIRLGERTVVARAPAGWALAEPHLAIDPRRPDRLLGVTIVSPAAGPFAEITPRATCRVVLSEDAGRTWRQHSFPVTHCFDPWLAFTHGSEAVLALSARHPAVDTLGAAEGLMVFHSPDGGRSWPERPLVLRRDPDHPTIAADTTGSQWRGSVYIMSGQSIRVSRSRDGGRTFVAPVRVTPNNLINLAEKPVVLSDGTLVLSFVDAAWWLDSTRRRLGRFNNRRSWVVHSTDGGESFSTPFFITDVCGRPPSFQQSFLVADPSPAYRDRLYFGCRRAGGGPIVVTHSSDRGSYWSEPVPVSAEPDDSTVSRVVAMAASPKGVLGVAWMVGRPTVPCQELWFTASVDGGRTFLPPKLISAPACAPIPEARWPTSGDYFGLAASPSGRFHVMWGEPGESGGILVHATVDVQSAQR
jgi:hypothetical protein